MLVQEYVDAQQVQQKDLLRDNLSTTSAHTKYSVKCICRPWVCRHRALNAQWPSLGVVAICWNRKSFFPLLTPWRLHASLRRAFIEVDPFNQANCPRLLWATFAFVNNRLPYAGCVSYTWSMAVQMQFYMITPVLLLLCKFSSTRHRSTILSSVPIHSNGLRGDLRNQSLLERKWCASGI